MAEAIDRVILAAAEFNKAVAELAATHDVCFNVKINHDVPARPVEIELVRFIEKDQR